MAQYYLEDRNVILWQPPWLELKLSQEEQVNDEASSEAKEFIQQNPIKHGVRKPGDDPIKNMK